MSFKSDSTRQGAAVDIVAGVLGADVLGDSFDDTVLQSFSNPRPEEQQSMSVDSQLDATVDVIGNYVDTPRVARTPEDSRGTGFECDSPVREADAKDSDEPLRSARDEFIDANVPESSLRREEAIDRVDEFVDSAADQIPSVGSGGIGSGRSDLAELQDPIDWHTEEEDGEVEDLVNRRMANEEPKYVEVYVEHGVDWKQQMEAQVTNLLDVIDLQGLIEAYQEQTGDLGEYGTAATNHGATSGGTGEGSRWGGAEGTGLSRNVETTGVDQVPREPPSEMPQEPPSSSGGGGVLPDQQDGGELRQHALWGEIYASHNSAVSACMQEGLTNLFNERTAKKPQPFLPDTFARPFKMLPRLSVDLLKREVMNYVLEWDQLEDGPPLVMEDYTNVAHYEEMDDPYQVDCQWTLMAPDRVNKITKTEFERLEKKIAAQNYHQEEVELVVQIADMILHDLCLETEITVDETFAKKASRVQNRRDGSGY